MAAGDALLHVSIKAEELFSIGPLHFTNSMVGALLASAILLILAWVFVRRPELVPGRMQSLIEFPIEWMADIVSGSTSRWRGYVALVIGLFLMILVANWLGLLPGVGTIGLAQTDEAGVKELVPFVRAGVGRPELHAWPGDCRLRRVRRLGHPDATASTATCSS